MPSFRLSVPALPESVGEVRDAVAGVAERAGLSDVWAVKMCVSEAITNAIVHAYADDPSAHVDVATATPRAGVLRVSVTDAGTGFQPTSSSPGLGLGLPLIAKLASRIDVTSGDRGGTVLFMEFTEAEMRDRAHAPASGTVGPLPQAPA